MASKRISEARIMRIKSKKMRKEAFKDIARKHPELVENVEKRKELWNTVQNIDFAVDGFGNLRMFYEDEEIK